jgi:hypothetical protein
VCKSHLRCQQSAASRSGPVIHGRTFEIEHGFDRPRPCVT